MNGRATRFLSATLLARSIPVVVLGLVTSALVVFKVRTAIDVGPGWDTYAFLANAADLAGKGFGYTEPHRPPMISVITSLWFRLAPLSEAAIQWVDGALTISGVLAIFLLLRRRVDTVLAFSGALAFLGTTPLWEYLGVGYTDTAAIALSAWALLAAIAATERHPGFYLVAGSLFTAAVMMRYTALLFAFPLLVWVLLRWRPFLHARYIAAGATIAIAVYVPFGLRYAARFDDALFPFLFAFSISETVTTPTGESAASAQAPYYIQNLPGLLSPPGLGLIGLALVALAAYGLYLAVIDHLSARRPSAGTLAIVVLGVTLAVAGQLSLGLAARQVTILLAVWLAWRAFAPPSGEPGPPRTAPASALDAAMLTWLLVYLDFHGHQTIQVSRYFITMAPGLIFFTLLGWRAIIMRAGDTLQATPAPGRQLAVPIRTLLILVVAAPLAVSPLLQAIRTVEDPDPFVVAARDSAHWLEENDPAIGDRTIYSDLWPLTAWYLGTEARPMPFFEDLESFAHELEKSRADYFVTLRSRRFEPYQEVHTTGPVTVLARTDTAPAPLPRVAYLGKSWDNYVEQLARHTFYLDSTAGRYGFEGSAFLDAYTAEELAQFDAVAVAGFRWRDRVAGERALREYVESGGSAIVDASQNLGGLAHSIADTIILDTMVRRGQLPPDARIELAPGFASRHPMIGPIEASPWIDETGGTWSGAYYETRPGTQPLVTLATVGDRPLIQVQSLGEGRIYWIAFNLPWHAFMSENPAEARLVQAVFDEAIAATNQPGRPIDASGF